MDRPEEEITIIQDTEEEQLPVEAELSVDHEPVSQDSSSIQISPTPKSVSANMVEDYEIDPMLFIQLGDHIYIEGKYGPQVGTVYYRSLERIHVRPVGVSNRVDVYELEQTDDAELFKEEYHVKKVIILQKREFPSFVVQNDFRAGQVIDTFTSSGEMEKRYQIKGVDKDNDLIRIAEQDQETGEVSEEERELPFEYVGIDPSESFQVISIFQYDVKEEPENGVLNDEMNSTAPEPTLSEDIQTDLVVEEEEYLEPAGEIELVRPQIFREATSYEQVIPDDIQKIDALNDFITNLDLSAQKNTKVIRDMRLLVETLHQLKKDTITYYKDGMVKGAKTISASTLSELIQMASVPLGRPVLDVVKKGYKLMSEDPDDQLEDTNEFVFVDFHEELDAKLARYSSLTSAPSVGSGASGQPTEWSDKSLFFNSYLTPWMPNAIEDPIWTALRDSEFFRTVAPTLTMLSENVHVFEPSVDGYLKSGSASAPPTFHTIPFGMERALSTTYRNSMIRTRQVFMEADKASLVSYLLFPLRAAPSLGSKRTYSLAVDSGRSHLPFKTMRTVLEEIGDPKMTGGTSQDIVLIDTTSQAYGNILLEDYLAGHVIPALGLGDTYYVLNQYGLDELELNERIAGVLQTKIAMYQQQLISAIGSLRKTIRETPAVVPQPNPLIASPNFLVTLRTQPLLSDAMDEYARINPQAANLDLGIVLYLMKHHNNYFQVTAGNHSLYIGSAFYRETLRQYHEQQRIEKQLEKNKRQSGKPPRVNKCKHVADMVSVRKIRDDEDRMHKLAIVYRTYQGARVDNWIHCNLCKEHFLCIHERLQLQAYLKPAEKAIIEKEILLKCSGGQFQGKYICRNCGQPIRDLDFENTLEFDDEGRPKSGRAVLEDRDALLEEKIEMMVNEPVSQSEPEEMNLNEEEQTCYDIVRELSERVGVELDRAGYRFIIQHTLMLMSSFPKPLVYRKQREINPKLPTFEVAFARKYLAACAGLFLVEFQTKIPSYKVLYELKGCKVRGLGGYPLVEEKEKNEGVQYLSCAISSIRREDGIFFQTAFHTIADPEARITGIGYYIQGILDKEVLKLDIVQANLAAKRAYDSQMGMSSSGAVGTDLRPHDQIPATFLPEQVILKPEEAAENAISPEVVQAMGSKGNTPLVRLWIRQAHALAKSNTKLIRSSPLSEVSCCFHPIHTSSAEWFKDLPALSRRTIRPYVQGQPMMPLFIPRTAELSVARPDKELYYRLFLKYCFQGPKMGYPHEPNLSNTCIWCRFDIPAPEPVLDTPEKAREYESRQRGEIARQQVDTSESKFNELLDSIHTHNEVTRITEQKILSVQEILRSFGTMEPAPVPAWAAILENVSTQLITITNHKKVDAGDLAMALTELSRAIVDARTRIETYFPRKAGTNEIVHRLIEEISKLSWINFFQVIQTYFILTFQRMLSGFKDKALFVPIELKKDLSSIHVNEDLSPLLAADTAIVKAYQDILTKSSSEFVKSKMKFALKQWSAMLSYKNEIRAALVPGRDHTLVYFQQLMLYGTLESLLDPEHIPDESMAQNPIRSSARSSTKFMVDLLVQILGKYNRERIAYNDKEIRDQIAIREERERVHVIAEFNRLTEEQRKIELIQKKLGIGKWAVGGTKLTYRYNADYYDVERSKRIAAGMGTQIGGPEELGELEGEMGRQYDKYGNPIMNEVENDEADGYDVEDQPDD